MTIPVGALVLYKQRPAKVEKSGARLDIVEADGRARTVRDKDLRLLHAGPVASLSDLQRAPADLEGARELLAEEPVSFADFIAICFDEDSPAAAWSAWALLFDGQHFIERDGLVHARSAEEVAKLDAARQAKEAEAQRLQSFKDAVKAGRCDVDGHAEYLAQIRRFVSGGSERCGILAELGCAQEVEAAHALLLRIGAVDRGWVPAVERCGVDLAPPPTAPVTLPPMERADHSAVVAYAIDDEGNTDPDDAIAFDGERIWVHIADVGSLVPPDGELDRQARERGATLYLPDQTVPMLPETCTQELGVGLQERSPALSIGFRIDEAGRVCDASIEHALVAVRRLSYQEADPLIDGELSALRDALAPAVRARHATARADFELPELRIRVHEGEVALKPLHRGPARQLVMEAMLQAGVAVSLWADARGIALPHASQPPPAATGPAGDSLSAMYARMRQMMPSTQSVEPGLHSGLGLERYVRATSPLRRYGDLLVHQQLAAALAGREPLSAKELSQRLNISNEAAARIRKAERFANRHWTLAYLLERGDWQGEAQVVELGPRSCLVIVPELALQCPMRIGGAALDQVVPVRVADIDLPRLEVRLKRVG